MSRSPDVRALCDSIRQDFPVSAVAAQAGVRLRRAGSELIACCPFHADRSPSFTIYDDDRRAHCFGCGWTGDVIDFVIDMYSVEWREAIGMLAAGPLTELEHKRAPGRAKGDTKKAALQIIEKASPVAGTPAEAYLRRRGISAPLPNALRFAVIPAPKNSGVREANGNTPLPALIAIVSDVDGSPAGIQRIYLTSDGRKAASADGKVKFSLGRVKGGAIRLAEAADGMALSGSVEDGLSLLEMGAPSVWAAPGEGMLHSVLLPETVRSIIIAGDADHEGRKAAERAGQAHANAGRSVRAIYPSAPFKDFNEELMGAGR